MLRFLPTTQCFASAAATPTLSFKASPNSVVLGEKERDPRRDTFDLKIMALATNMCIPLFQCASNKPGSDPAVHSAISY